jgi:hypothetical protein
MKKLPCGIHNFAEIIEDGYTYVDKTEYIYKLVTTGKPYFLSRPRRFGKSLFLSTLKCFFQGRKELFKGLYIEEFMNREEFQACPVIHLDMSQVVTNEGLDILRNSIGWILLKIAEDYDIEIDKTLPPGIMFSNLIRGLSRKSNAKVVVLVDEYDKPLTDLLTSDADTIKNVKDILRNFYIHIKVNEEYIKFVLITGIAKFTKVGIFSTLNNITDISPNKQYSAMCGYTEEEIIKYFPDYIELTANEMQLTATKLLEKMKNYYDGFCFDGETKLYNPYSTLMFFCEWGFFNYWIETGTSKYLNDYLKDRHLTIEQFRNLPISQDFARSPGEIDNATPESYLYQSGYLTLRPGITDDYSLDYPNTEVLNSMSKLFAENVLEDKTNIVRTSLSTALVLIDTDKIVEVFNCLLASIPYDDFAGAARQSVYLNQYKFSAQEWLYRSTILAFLRGCGIASIAEMHTNLGRPDIVISHRGNVYVIELKVVYEGEDPTRKAEEAINQIIDKNYAKPYPNAVCLAMVIDDSVRQITDYKTNK